MLKFLIINGPNINMLGLREPDIYGTENYRSLQQFIYHCCVQEDIEPVLYQSNHEGAIVDRIQAAYGDADGIVINPAAYTHTSVAHSGGRGAPVGYLGEGELPPDFVSGHGLPEDLCRAGL